MRRLHQEKEPDEAVEQRVARDPDMPMMPAQEESGRAEVLDAAVRSAEAAGLSGDTVGTIHEIVNHRWNVFRRVLRVDPLANVQPLTVTLKPGVQAVKASPRSYNPSKMA